MDEHQRTAKVSPEIYVYATNKNFLNIYDALRIDKVKIEIAGYDQNSGRQTGIASAWLDVDDLRLLAHLVITRQFKDVLDRGRFEKFGGSDRDGAVESRLLLVEWDPGQDNKFARYPYRLTISNGPGLRTPNGAVQPQGKPTSTQAMRMPEADMIKIMLTTYDYVHAYETAHHHRIIAQKVREVQEKLAGRAERRLPVAAAPDDEERLPNTVGRPAPAALRVVPGGAAEAPAARPAPARTSPPPAGRPGAPAQPPIVANNTARPPAAPMPDRSRPVADESAPRYTRPTRAS